MHVVRIVLLATMAVVLLAACGTADSGSGVPASTTDSAVAATAASRAHATTTPPVPSAPDTSPGFDGIGPLHFGMTAGQMRAAWGMPLYGQARPDDPQACHYLSPREQDNALRFMVEGDRFVRVDVDSAAATAPGGGRIGMHAQQIEKLYAGRVTASPNKYDPAARTLRVTPEPADNKALIFDTDASGTVKSWRIGVTPQIDYVEGCS